MEKKKLELIMAVTLIAVAVFLSTRSAIFTGSSKAEEKEPVIVIDAGHGGC